MARRTGLVAHELETMTDTPIQAAARAIRPLYSCGVPECAQEVSFPAHELHWVDDGVDPGFYCYECIISSGTEEPEVGTSLADALASIGALGTG